LAVDIKKTEAPKGQESSAYTFVAVCKVEDLPEGEVKQLEARGKEIAVGRLAGGQLFAVQGRCPHLRARLGKGHLEGSLLVCPWHGSKFDVTDGCMAQWVQEPMPLKALYDAILPFALKGNVHTYETKEEGGEVLIAID
jgi:nitrite reductase/ring-hydroxylating ferredoxin subunit